MCLVRSAQILLAVTLGVSLAARSTSAQDNPPMASNVTASQPQRIQGRHQPYALDSGQRDNPTDNPTTVFQHFIVLSPEVPWIRVLFSSAVLAPGSRLRITSLTDGEVQTLDSQQLREWQNSTAYFNGPSLKIELVAGPRTAGNTLKIGALFVGNYGATLAPRTICGNDDDRVIPVTPDPSVGRLLAGSLYDQDSYTLGCTAFIADTPAATDDKCHLSAGNCFQQAPPLPHSVLQFDVPASSSNCDLQHPPVSKQFAVAWFQTQSGAPVPGDDWVVFRCFPNPVTGLTTFQEQGAAFSLAGAVPTTGDARVTGYGIDGNDGATGGDNAACDPCNPANLTGQRTQIQQTATGPLLVGNLGQVNHQVDTCDANAGSPIILESTGQVIGIHTQGGCTTSPTEFNSGTEITHAPLQNAIANCGETLCFGWTEMLPPVRPPARQRHAVVFDAERGVVVLYGGVGNTQSLADTWEWDGSTWTERFPALSPSTRWVHTMAYDSLNKSVVLFGGFDGSFLNETWEWDGINWALKTPANSPPGRALHATAYDSDRNRLVLFAGDNGGGTFLGDTWEWDGTNWTQSCANCPPAAREGHAMAYDAARGVVVLFGGSSGIDLADTWEWDGTTWIERFPTVAPPPRSRHSMAYDAARGRVILFADSGLGDNRTWAWDGSNWAALGAASRPPGRTKGHGLAYDSARSVAVLFAGLPSGGALIDNLDDTWELQTAPASTSGAADCNANGVLDVCEIDFGASDDFDQNGVPDECDPDCGANGITDACDIDCNTGNCLAHPLGCGSSSDCNANGIPDDCDITTEKPFIIDGGAQPIPDCSGGVNTAVTQVFIVPDTGTIADLDVDLQIAHTWVGDLVVQLQSPAGTVVTLMSRVGLAEIDPFCSAGECCGNASDDVNVLFDDDAPNSIEDAPTLSGTFHPDAGATGDAGTLSTFNGQDKQGSWTLTVSDNSGFQFGTVLGWSLHFVNLAPTSPDCNTNTTPDECEIELNLSQASGPLAPLGTSTPQSFTIPSAPNAIGDVLLGFQAVGNLNADTENVTVDINGTQVGVIFTADTVFLCQDPPSTDQLVVPAATFNAAVNGGDAVINMVASLDVLDGSCNNLAYISLSVNYQIVAGLPDCNGNGTLDECELAAGTAQDCDTNGMPDDCQPDTDNDGTIDPCDLCPFLCGDIDGSGGNINLLDFATFALCFGELSPFSGPCACSNLTGDNIVNLLDFATFALMFGDASTNTAPNCP